ncbi:MAG: L-cystine transport system permease protein YecS [Candidatus Anoxychlamydiales bacterium]|uniref:ABC transmembrane type-1 domain-containing protein n=1 Tax=marine sediment metagenome TaxID=412755 RepID=A0A0F9NJ77_9ZZZZ|nr:L-cystine transport system permease protein YecS [Candidatus Anoxychlamydiales bacterium]NGX41671.1 L-cystine transport system permease protein YecS [Candidatus Anoxychlamydiales bacterium]
MIDTTLIFTSLPKLLYGTLITLQIVVIAFSIGIIFGTLISILETSKSLLIRSITHIYIASLRGTPTLVQILFIYYVLPQFNISIDPLLAASIAIGLNCSAYISQIIKSGINAIPIGQIEAAKTLGLSSFITMKDIILPQVFKTSLPSFGNELIALIKDSSLASIIGVMELSKEGSIIRSRTYDAFSILLAISLIYLLLTTAVSFGIKSLERNLKKNAQS